MEDLIKSAGAPFGARAKARVVLLASVRRAVAERLADEMLGVIKDVRK